MTKFSKFLAHCRKPTFVYLAERSDGYIKIGYSRHPEDRVQVLSGDQLSSRGPHIEISQMTRGEYLEFRKVRLVRVVRGDILHERMLHLLMEVHRAAGCREWYHDTDDSRVAINRYLDVMQASARGDIAFRRLRTMVDRPERFDRDSFYARTSQRGRKQGQSQTGVSA